MPLRMRGLPSKEREARVVDALSWVGLLERAKHRPYELSGGEQQMTIVVVTHDPQVMVEADIVHELRDGRLIDTRLAASA